MASEAELLRFKRLIGDTELSDAELTDLLDANEGNFNAAAYEYWLGVAGTYVHMVNMTENSSRRDLSDLHDHALKQAKFFKDQLDQETPGEAGISFTYELERP